jgi:hypothetical protein
MKALTHPKAIRNPLEIPQMLEKFAGAHGCAFQIHAALRFRNENPRFAQVGVNVGAFPSAEFVIALNSSGLHLDAAEDLLEVDLLLVSGSWRVYRGFSM